MNWLRTLIREEASKLFRERVIELDPDKSYMVVLPEDFDVDSLRNVVKGGMKTNIIFLSAEKVTLLEIE